MPTSQSSSVAALGGTQGFARKEPATGSQSAVQRVVEAVAERVEAILDGELREQERGASFGASATTTETDPELEALRERRLEALKRAAAARSRWCALGHGRLHELDDEEALLEACRSSERVVGVFWRLRTAPETQPLQDALAHALRSLAQQHLETRFWVAEAERFPSMCERLGVQVLPSILLIRNQQVVRTFAGLDEWVIAGRAGVRFSLERLAKTLRRHRITGVSLHPDVESRDAPSDSD